MAVREDRPQHLVPPLHLGQRGLQEVHLQGAVQPQDHRQVVGDRIRLQLAEEPETFLGERERSVACRIAF